MNINIIKYEHMPHLPQSEEREFYDMVVCGDIEGIEKLRREYSCCMSDESEKGSLSPDPVRNEIYHLVANCTIITRKCIAAGMPQEDAFSLSDMFIRRADSRRTKEAVQRVNDDMVMAFAKRMNKILRLNSESHSKGVAFAIRYISDNIFTKFTAGTVAELAGYERSYFSGLFHNEMGITLTRYILEQKIEVAKSLISEGIELSQISEMLGFTTQSYFGRRFESVTGMTPGIYRKLMESDNMAAKPKS